MAGYYFEFYLHFDSLEFLHLLVFELAVSLQLYSVDFAENVDGNVNENVHDESVDGNVDVDGYVGESVDVHFDFADFDCQVVFE